MALRRTFGTAHGQAVSPRSRNGSLQIQRLVRERAFQVNDEQLSGRLGLGVLVWASWSGRPFACVCERNSTAAERGRLSSEAMMRSLWALAAVRPIGKLIGEGPRNTPTAGSLAVAVNNQIRREERQDAGVD